MPLEALYQNLILEHCKNPRNFGTLEGASVRRRHEDPACGDHIELYVATSADGGIREIKFESWGCALSRASASMMTLSVQQQSRARALEIMAAFHTLFIPPHTRVESLGELNAFAGVSEFPARIACALLPWSALAESLSGSA